MSYVKSKEYPGWVYDSVEDTYVSPSGRLAVAPGAPFHGTLSKKEHALIKEKVNEVIEKPITESDVANMGYKATAEVVKTITIGSVTINWIRIS